MDDDFKPMLAATAKNLAALTYPKLVSAKLDGIRAVIRGGVVLSRSMKPIPNRAVQKQFGLPELEGLDGEFLVGDPTAANAFRLTSSHVMSFEGELLPNFHVFDEISIKPFAARQASLTARLKRVKLKPLAGGGLVKQLHHFAVADADELLNLEGQLVDAGYEGVMLRDPAGPYKQGRSTELEGWLLKLKRFFDSEAVVTGSYELMHNDNVATRNELGQQVRSSKKAGLRKSGFLGGLHVRDLTSGVDFDLGAGFDASERELFWKVRHLLVGRVVTYKFMKYGMKDKPRLPIYKGFRDQLDL